MDARSVMVGGLEQVKGTRRALRRKLNTDAAMDVELSGTSPLLALEMTPIPRGEENGVSDVCRRDTCYATATSSLEAARCDRGLSIWRQDLSNHAQGA